MCTPSFMCKFPFSGRECFAERGRVPYAWARTARRPRQAAGGTQPMRKRRHRHTPDPSRACAWRSTACRCATREAMLDGRARERADHRRRLRRRRGRRVPDARRPPPRRAHRLPVLRALLGPLHARADGARGGRPSASVSILVAQLQASLASEVDGLELATRDRRAPRAAARRAPAQRVTPRRADPTR